MTVSNKISLFLMTKKGYFTLKSIIGDGKAHLVDLVIIGKDANVECDYSDDILQLCSDHNIRYAYRKDSYKIVTKFTLAVSWKWIIEGVENLIVIHDSLLPKYRGFAPLVSALKNGDDTVGVTAIFAEKSYDTGDIIHRLKINVDYPVTINEMIDKISELYGEISIWLIGQIGKGGQLPRNKQDEKLATYSLWLDEDDYLIDWKKSSDEILRFINSTGSPYKNASSYIGSKKIRIKCAEIFPDVVIENRTAGKVIFKDGGYPVVVCGKGLLKLTGVADDETGERLLPVKELRIRFTGRI
jgi:methionyl-tRNA formyltransferase